MKKLLYILLLLPVMAAAQSQDQNYVKTVTYRKPFDSAPALPLNEDRQIQVNYFDGLGRPIQSVTSKAGSDYEDIIVPMEYDNYGRQIREYLPYANLLSHNTITAAYRADALNPTAADGIFGFYNEPKYENTLNPYSEKYLESSPLSRIFEQAAPGEDWKLADRSLNNQPAQTFNAILEKCSTGGEEAGSGSVKIENNILIVELTRLGMYNIGGTPTIPPARCFIQYGIPVLDNFELPDLELGVITDQHGFSTGYKAVIENDKLWFRPVVTGIYPEVHSVKVKLYADLSWLFGGGHTIKYDYQANRTGEVRRFSVGFDIVNGVVDTERTQLLTSGYYAANQLYKTITRDENWTPADGNNKTTEEFKDKLGRVVLKRTYNEDEPHDTYYVYDKFSNLTYVIPPLAADKIVEQSFSLTPVGTNFPWTHLALVDGKLAADYERELEQYDNSEILNLDLMDRYGGQGGFSIASDEQGGLVLNINITLANPMELKNGTIADLKPLGNFSDRELGRISGSGYDYIFTVADGKLRVTGSGMVPSQNVSLTGETKLEYTKNYSWAAVCTGDQNIKNKYLSDIENLPNSEILTIYTPNAYGAMGGVAVTLEADDTISISFNIASDTLVELREGIAFPLDIQRRLPDMPLGQITGDTYSYEFSIEDNSLRIKGGGLFNNLVFLGSRRPLYNYQVNQAVVEGLCYIYHYDRRNRVVEKYIPGNGWTHMVYDKLDRLALTQDERMRPSEKWLYTGYDALDRVVITGIYQKQGANRLVMQSIYDMETEVESHRRSSTPYPYTLNDAEVYYTGLGSKEIHTINYYDDYDFDLPGLGITKPAATVYGDALTNNTTGLLTATRVLVLGTNDWITTVNGYDDKGRLIWSHTKDPFLESDNIVETDIDFAGQVLETKTQHLKAGKPELVVRDYYKYDHTGRLLKHSQKAGGIAEQLIVYNKYDELGQLEQKKVGGAYNASASYSTTVALQTVDYKYNIRGWLKAINDAGTTLTDDLFAFKIAYNTPDAAAPLYNGNIAETKWKSKTDNQMRGYGYEYDALNRINEAYFHGAGSGSAAENYREGQIAYDKNGNIQHLERFGKLGTGYDKIDMLTYKYQPSSNKLLAVIDNAGTTGFNNGNTGNNDDYSYDITGNMELDRNKGITGISYNHLNLPVGISFANGNTIIYDYDATGVKLRKRVIQGSTVTVTDYNHGFMYKDNFIQFFPHPEGYVNVHPPLTNGETTSYANFDYIYQYKDHLGNVRLSYTKGFFSSVEVVEEDNYYPFGMKHTGYNNVVTSTNIAQKYKYHGQERQDELGLNWDSFKWRNYDYAIARFFNIDPLAEDYVYNSPYAFAENKIGMGRELEGCELGPFINFALAEPPVSTPLLGASDAVKLSAEVGGKTEAATRLSQNATRGRAVETEQLAKNGLEKNTESFTRTDPATGQETTTIPDAVKPGGGTVEIKNVQKQSLTRQLRAQRQVSNENGVKPELIINESARLSKPLQEGGFDIKTYNNSTIINTPAIDNTNVPKPRIDSVAEPKEIEITPLSIMQS